MGPKVNLELKWEDQKVTKRDGQWTVDGRPVVVAEPVYHQQPSNTPGMTFVGLKVTAPPNAATPPHRHGGAAVVATMIRGSMLNQMICDGHTGGPKVYHQGDSWYEPPGCHHVRSENAGNDEAVFVANFIIDSKSIEEKGLLSALLQFDADQGQDGTQ